MHQMSYSSQWHLPSWNGTQLNTNYTSTVHISHITYSFTAFNVPYTHSLLLIYNVSKKFTYCELKYCYWANYICCTAMLYSEQ